MCTHISLMHYCLGSSRGNRGHAGEKRIFSGSIAHALHEMVHGFMHDYPMHDISNHKLLSKKKQTSSHAPSTWYPRGAATNRALTKPVSSLQLVTEDTTRLPRLEFPFAHTAASRLTASSFLLGTFPSDAPSSNNKTAVFGCPPQVRNSGIGQSADGPYSPHGSYASPQGRGISCTPPFID